MMYTIDPVHALSRKRPFRLTDAMEDPIQVAAAAGFADNVLLRPRLPESFILRLQGTGAGRMGLDQSLVKDER